MAQAQERARITEIQVRMDCNGCVQKIKKALQGINGISDVYIDLPHQKLTIIGWADPEKIIKAIKKARKTATIYSHSEVQEPPPTQPTAPDNEARPPSDDNKPPEEQPEPPKDQPPPPPSEPPKDQPPPAAENPSTQPPPQENPNHEPPPPPVDTNEAQHNHQHKEVVEEVHVIHHHPPDYRYRPGYSPGYNPERAEPPRYSHGPRDYRPGYNPEPPRYSHGPQEYNQGYDHDYSPEHPRYSQSYGPGYNPGPPGYNPSYSSRLTGYSQGYDEPGYNPGPHGHIRSQGYSGDWSGRPESSYRPERPQPVQVTHSYNQYRPQPNVTQYEYVQSPPRFTPYGRTESSYYYNNGDYQNDNSYDYNSSNNGYASSIFSEENPNACIIS